MPYFRCPNCCLMVHMVGNQSAEVKCSRCHVKLAPTGGLAGTFAAPRRPPAKPT